MNDGALQRLQPVRRRGPVVVFCLSLVSFWAVPSIAVLPYYMPYFDGSFLANNANPAPPSPVASVVCLTLSVIILGLSILSFRRRRRDTSPGLSVAALGLASVAVLEQILILLVFYTNAAGLYS